MRIIDRYVIRQVLMPFCLGLMVFTFLLIIPALITQAEAFVAKGVSGVMVLRLMATLIPQALALTIPMSLLLGLLIAFGKLSADREFVAMQACGVSLMRLLRPVGVLGVVCWAATSYVMIVALPSANQTFRELTYNIVAQLAEGEVRPRVFFDQFPDLQLYVRDIPPGGGWNGVFMSVTRPGQAEAVYVARQGRVVLNRERRTVDMVLEDATTHTIDAKGEYKVGHSARLVMSVDPEAVFPRHGPAKGDNEMTITELRARIAELDQAGISTHNQWIAIHRKFSIPVACLVFCLIGLALGATNRRDGALGSFVLGLVIVFAYYVPLTLGPAMAKGHLIPPWVAAWLPNILIGALAIALFVWRDRVADQPIRLNVPEFVTRRMQRRRARRQASERTRGGFVHILDRYVALTYFRILLLSASALMAIFYVSTFIDLSDKVFKGAATWTMLGQYLVFETPQYAYYVLPLAVLLGALVTIGLLTKNSELIVMKACGISLYRVALPMLGCAVIAAGVLFGLDQTILGPANFRADAIKHVMRGGSPETFNVLNRHWAAGSDGSIYHYVAYNPRTQQLSGLQVFRFADNMTRISSRLSADRADYAGGQDSSTSAVWNVQQGWTRDFDAQGEVRDFTPFAAVKKQFETASYFGTEQPDAKYMSYTQLRAYNDQLREGGFDVLEQQVALARKLSFPFVTLIMTLIAVPFAVTMGRSGAMAGIGIGIGLAITYWMAISVFAAIGSGGLIAPVLAAWAPNALFGAGAAYLLLTVRT
jgi:LPS export ABC transporter permease LptG/LPS export ABC transporter permease LptF